MTIRILTIMLLLFSAPVFGQLEASRWYFGNGAGLNFNEGPPVPFNGSAVNTIESSAAISNASGNLLFYTDGITVFNLNNTAMENGEGLFGELSSTNGVLILPAPGNSSHYFIFTADAIQNYQAIGQGVGVNYSIVDMNANGGLGAVIDKNINLLAQGSEKLTAVKSDNGFWLLTHYGNRFYAYPVTTAGVGVPIITTIGPNVSDFNNIRGAIKFSPDGSRVAVCHTYFEPNLNGQIFLYDFDSATGILSNQILLADDIVYYGVAFSPNSQVLYTSGKVPINGGQDTGNSKVYQYNLQAVNIVASRFELADYLSSPFVNLAGILQVAIDGKLYHSVGGPKLSVVLLPNRIGDNCNFQYKTVGLGLNTSSIGLPPGNQEYYKNIIEYEGLCSGDATAFFLNTNQEITSVQWDFGDPTSGILNESNILQPVHVFSEVSSFTITAMVTYASGVIETFRVIIKNVIAPLLMPATLTQCDVDGEPDGRTPFNLNDALDVIFVQDVNDIDGINLRFFINQIDAQLSQNEIPNPFNYINVFDGQVIYASVAQSLDCVRITPITLSVDAGAQLEDLEVVVCSSSLGENSAVVEISSIIEAIEQTYPDVLIRLYESIEFAGLQTSEKSGFILFDFSDPNILYYRLGDPDECIGIGLVSVILEDPIVLEDKELVICFADNGAILEGPIGFVSYEWSNGETSQDLFIIEPGIYTVDVILFAGCAGSVSYTVIEGPALQTDVSVVDFVQNNKIIIDATLSEGTVLYSIDGGSTFSISNVFSGLAPGVYNVVIRDEVGCNLITKQVLVRGAPRYFTPNNDGFNDRWHVKNVQNYVGIKIDVFDRFGKQITTLTDRSQGWDGVYNGKMQATSTYWYSITYEEKITYGYFTLITRNGL